MNRMKRARRSRQTTGFTLIEMMLVTAMLSLLYAMSVPNFIALSNRAKNAAVVHNMHTTQTAVELAGVDTGGVFPADIDDAVKSYFPQGGHDGITPAPAGLPNPFTNVKEWPTVGALPDLTAARDSAPVDVIGEGILEYSPLYDDPDAALATSYAIRGGGVAGKVLGSMPGHTLVLSSQ